MIAIRSLATMAICVSIAAASQAALAAPFMPVLDEFWIVKNGTEIFRDSFADATPPPSGPDGATTYFVFGPGGITDESSGNLTLTPALGEPTLITAIFADVATEGLRLSSTNSANPNFLGQDSSFEIHALYDLSTLPATPGQSFGVRATDRAVALGNAGNNTYALLVGVSPVTGDVVVFLRLLDFSTDFTTVIQSISIQSLLAAADQIELILSKGTDLDRLTASYALYDLNDAVLGSGSVGAGAALTIYDGENYIRAQFSSTDRVAVPEPGTLAAFGLGIVLLLVGRRSKTPR